MSVPKGTMSGSTESSSHGWRQRRQEGNLRGVRGPRSPSYPPLRRRTARCPRKRAPPQRDARQCPAAWQAVRANVPRASAMNAVAPPHGRLSARASPLPLSCPPLRCRMAGCPHKRPPRKRHVCHCAVAQKVVRAYAHNTHRQKEGMLCPTILAGEEGEHCRRRVVCCRHGAPGRLPLV